MFPNEHIYDDIVAVAEEKWGVPASIIKAVIGEESSFSQKAGDQYREEKDIGDASYGPMQILFRTAVEMGFPNDPTRYMELMNPPLNIDLGTKYLNTILARMAAKGQTDISDVYAYYNAGAVQKDSLGRYVNSKGNPAVQARVNRFMPIYEYFMKQEAEGTLLLKKA